MFAILFRIAIFENWKNVQTHVYSALDRKCIFKWRDWFFSGCFIPQNARSIFREPFTTRKTTYVVPLEEIWRLRQDPMPILGFCLSEEARRALCGCCRCARRSQRGRWRRTRRALRDRTRNSHAVPHFMPTIGGTGDSWTAISKKETKFAKDGRLLSWHYNMNG